MLGLAIAPYSITLDLIPPARSILLELNRLAKACPPDLTALQHGAQELGHNDEEKMKHCKKCNELKPENSDYFNLLSSGNYRGTCKKCMAENTMMHYYKNPQKVMDRVSKYKEQKELAGGYTSDIEKTTIRKEQEDRCSYCGVELNGGGELDHKTPVSRGGDNSPGNMAWACITCNRDKHNKTVEEFELWRKEREYRF